MIKAKRLFAAVLVVIMAMSVMTFSAFASDELVFSEDYTTPVVQEGSAAVKNTAVMITAKAKGKEEGTEIIVNWEGEDYIFEAGVNAFPMEDLKDAIASADVFADGGLPQILLEAGNYQTLEITGSVQIFGTHWNDNPNTVNPNDPTAVWTKNTAWDSDVTKVNDVIINAAATGTIDIYGIEITHRFYDCYRPISAIKTVLTLRNIHFYQTDKITSIGAAGANSRTLAKCAMTFWNYNAANTGATAVNNKDETYLINFRLGKLDMDSGGDNRFIDEIMTPNMTIDGFCADYTGFNCGQMFWMKWRDANTQTKCVVKNSYFTAAANDKFDFDFEGYYDSRTPDVSKGDKSELIFENNIFYNHTMANGYSNLRVYQPEYTMVSVRNNLFINTKGGSPDLFRWANLSGGDLSERMEFIDNTFLGYSSLNIYFGSSATKIDMTGSYISETYSADYKNQTSEILPTGNVRYDYCYLDGARTVSTSEIRDFTMEADVTVDKNAKTMFIEAADGVYERTLRVTDGLGIIEVYESDSNFTNEYDFAETDKVTKCVLKDKVNYFLFVWYSPDHSNYEVYKLTIRRPDPVSLKLTDVITEQGAVIDGVKVIAVLDKDTDTFTFTPVCEQANATFKLTNLETGAAVAATNGNTFTVDGLVRGEVNLFKLEISQGTTRQHYTVEVKRPFNSAAVLVSIDEKLSRNGNVFTALVEKNATEFSFDIDVCEDATAIAWAGTTAFPLVDGKITITDLSVTEYSLAVVAEDGEHVAKYTLKLNKVKSTAKELISVKDATKTADGYKVTVADKFTVNATVSAGATYAVYSDAACTNKLEGNVVPAGTTAYIVVTAENGASAPAVKIVVEKKAEQQEEEKPVEIKDSSKVFTDIKDKWYKDAVDYNYSYGFISGVSATEFGINTPVTRGMFITVLARIAGVDTSNAANKAAKTKFNDVKTGKYYTAAIKWASENGVVDGVTDTTFAPDSAIERQQLCVMIVNFAKYMKVDLKATKAEIAFKDSAAIMKYAKDAVKVCQMAEIVNGYQVSGGYEFRPANTATREEAAQIIYKFHKDFVK